MSRKFSTVGVYVYKEIGDDISSVHEHMSTGARREVAVFTVLFYDVEGTRDGAKSSYFPG